MSYTYLLEQGEESSAECFSDIPASVLSNGTSTPAKSCSQGSATDACHASPSGTTCKPSTGSLGAGASMSSAGASRAKTSAQPERAQESTESGRECGTTWPESLAKYDLATSSWRTPQCSLLGDSDEFSETWPRWGMMRNGVCWGRTTPGHRTKGTESGFWPTPTCMAGAMYLESNALKRNSMSLASAVHYWITPMARDYKGHTNNPKNRGYGGTLPDQVKERTGGGQLNPPWVEWLMGWPIGWTDLNESAMDKFQQWRHSHSKCFPLVLANT